MLWLHLLSVIQVRVHDQTTSGGGICSSYNDPHMQTFDGIYWENQRVGEFVMYRHKTKPFSVSGEKYSYHIKSNTFYYLSNRQYTVQNHFMTFSGARAIFCLCSWLCDLQLRGCHQKRRFFICRSHLYKTVGQWRTSPKRPLWANGRLWWRRHCCSEDRK